MSAGTLAAALVFGLMILVTALSQRSAVPLFSWIKRHDPCALIPVWTFFAPNPGTRDVRLLWRERLCDDTVSPWRETTPPDAGRWRVIWNPHKRARKAVTDVCPSVLRRVAQRPENPLTVVSIPYLMIANHICGIPGAPMAAARQFLIAYTEGQDTDRTHPRVQFVSHWHDLPGSSRGADRDDDRSDLHSRPAAVTPQ